MKFWLKTILFCPDLAVKLVKLNVEKRWLKAQLQYFRLRKWWISRNSPR